MKNVLLISPHSSAKHNETRYVCPAPGILRIAGFLKSNGHYAETFDPNLHDLDKRFINLEDKLKEREWDIIGVSCLEETLAKDMENLWSAKRITPRALIIAGGIEAQYNYQTILDKTPCTVVVIGEGEIPMRMICENKPLHRIPGIIFKNKAQVLTQEQFEEMSSKIEWERIPFENYWDFYIKKYGNNITPEVNDQIHTIRIFAKNRCPFLCKFCTSTHQLQDASGSNVKAFGIHYTKLVELVKRVYTAHPRVRTIYFTDDDFCLNKNEVINFCRLIIEQSLNSISYMCFSRITDLNDDMLSWMKKAGFRRLNIGVESFSDKILKEVDKKCTVNKIIENLEKVKRHGIQAFITIMLITPKSSLEDLVITVNKITELMLDPFYTFGVSLAVRPTKGSRFYEMYYDFETYVTEIKNSETADKKPCLIKENKMIYALDPIVREIQSMYYAEETEFLKEFIDKQHIKHATLSNVIYAQIKLMQNCVDTICRKHNLPEQSWSKSL